VETQAPAAAEEEELNVMVCTGNYVTTNDRKAKDPTSRIMLPPAFIKVNNQLKLPVLPYLVQAVWSIEVQPQPCQVLAKRQHHQTVLVLSQYFCFTSRHAKWHTANTAQTTAPIRLQQQEIL
jgi:hypothetical protein